MKVELESKYNVGDEVYIPSDDYGEAIKCRIDSIILIYTTDLDPHEQFKYCVKRVSSNRSCGMQCQFRVFNNEADCSEYCKEISERIDEDRYSDSKD